MTFWYFIISYKYSRKIFKRDFTKPSFKHAKLIFLSVAFLYSLSIFRGISVVSAVASNARGPGFDPSSRRGKVSVSDHAFLSVICRGDIEQVRFPSGRDVKWRSTG